MSIINQMLRDLDARGTAPAEHAAANHHVPAQRRGPGARLVAFLLVLVSAGGLAGYFVVSGALNKAPPPSVVAMAQPEAVPVVPMAVPEPAPVMLAPPVQAAVHATPELSLVESVAKPGSVVAGLKPPVARPAQMARLPVAPKPIVQEVRSTSAFVLAPALALSPMMAEPSVVKKSAEPTPETEAQQHYDDAQALRRAGKAEAAIEKYRLALERNPGMRSARTQLARLLQDSGQPDAALFLLKAGYEQKPDDGLAIAAGRLLADQGRREEALSWLERGRDGLRPADHALMGALLSQTLRYEAAVKSYQRALATDPNQGGWLLGLGLALEAMGRIEDAHVVYRNALERGDFKPEVARFLRQKLGMTGL
jgi:MSHA biogenesis protein MshN